MPSDEEKKSWNTTGEIVAEIRINDINTEQFKKVLEGGKLQLTAHFIPTEIEIKPNLPGRDKSVTIIKKARLLGVSIKQTP